MSRVRKSLFLFNRGMVSPLALARVTEEDRAADRVRLSAEEQNNFMPRTLGSMMLRPGLKYTGTTASNNKAVYIPFVKATDDFADVEFTASTMRIWVDDAVVTRTSVSSAISNGTFATDLTGWSDDDETGATSAWATGGYMSLTGTGFSSAIRRQSVTVALADQGTVHGLHVVISRGEVTLSVGATSGGNEYFELLLSEGEYSLAFTPTGNFHISLSAVTKYASLVNSIAVESSGAVTIAAPYVEADLGLIRWEQSVDVIFLACDGYRQYAIKRYGTTSWGLTVYWVDDGPFRADNLTKTTLTPSAVSGDITLTSSNPVFTSANVGSIYRIGSIGQYVTVSVTAEAQWSNAISVSGVGAARDITVVRSGTWSANVTLQRSSDEGTTWADVVTYTTNATVTYNDALDNQDLQYRIGVDTGDYTSGTAVLSLTYATGSLTGVARVVEYQGGSICAAIVLTEMGGTSASSDWSEGEWSDRRGFPTVPVIYEGRLTWLGRGKVQMSESDAYTDFDPDTVGDSGPVNRTIGFGAVDNINWAFSGSRLLIGADGSEIVTRQGLDEVVTPSNTGFVSSSRIGSARVPCAVIDDTPVFVQRCTTKLYGMTYDPVSYKFAPDDMMEIAPELGEPSIVRVAVQRQPDTRIHAVRSDGKVVIKISEPAEETSALILFETDGFVEDAYVQPGTTEDAVYYIVRRSVNGSTVRYREKWALENECQGGTLCRLADSFTTYQGASTTSMTGLSHLEAKTVAVWGGGATIGSYAVSSGQITGLSSYALRAVVVRNAADDGDHGIFEVNSSGVISGLSSLNGSTVVVRETGKDLGTYTVASGAITLSEAVTDAVIGLVYRGRFKSVKLAYGAEGGTALTQVKRIDHIGPILRNTHYQGLKYGRDFDNLWDLPPVRNGRATSSHAIYVEYDQTPFEFDGEYNTDSRLVLQATSPRPCTILAVVFEMQTNER